MTRIVSTGRTLTLPEYQKKKQEEKRRKVIFWSALAVLVLSAFIILARLEQFHIKEVKVSGGQVITESEVSRSVLETLGGSYFWLIPKANAALYPRSEVKENLSKEFPRFSTIDLSLEGRGTLFVRVTERDPYALYCPSAERPEDASSCFFVDETGFIFDEAPAFSGVVYFVYAKKDPLDNPKGQAFLPYENFRDLSSFVEALPELGFEPLAVEVGEREVVLVLPGSTKILWETGADLALLYSNLESFLNTEEIKADQEFLNKILSLDLRTENKVFYKFK